MLWCHKVSVNFTYSGKRTYFSNFVFSLKKKNQSMIVKLSISTPFRSRVNIPYTCVLPPNLVWKFRQRNINLVGKIYCLGPWQSLGLEIKNFICIPQVEISVSFNFLQVDHFKTHLDIRKCHEHNILLVIVKLYMYVFVFFFLTQ